MKALLPVYCRPLGYFVIALALFRPFLMMLGALMILFALTKGECKATEEIRNKATHNAMFLTVLFIFGGMLYRVAQGDIMSVDSSSFLIFLIMNVLCLEFGIKKATVDNLFKRNNR